MRYSSPVNLKQGGPGDAISVIPEDRSNDARIAETWKQEWEASGQTSTSPRIGPRRRRQGRRSEPKTLDDSINRLRTGVSRYKASMDTWGLADSAECECGEPEQTADPITNSCPLHRPPSEAGLFEVGPLTSAWLQLTELTI